MVEVAVTVVEKITTTTEKSQCFTEVQELSGRSGYNFNFSGEIANCCGFMSRKMNCDYGVAKTTTSTTKTGNAL